MLRLSRPSSEWVVVGYSSELKTGFSHTLPLPGAGLSARSTVMVWIFCCVSSGFHFSVVFWVFSKLDGRVARSEHAFLATASCFACCIASCAVSRAVSCAANSACSVSIFLGTVFLCGKGLFFEARWKLPQTARQIGLVPGDNRCSFLFFGLTSEASSRDD